MSWTSDRPIEGSTYAGIPAFVPVRTRTRRLGQAVLESAILAVLLVVVNVEIFPQDPGLLNLAPHPTLLIGLLVLVRYGLAPGLVSAMVLAVAHGTSLLLLANAPTPHHLLEAPYSTPIVILFPLVTILGAIVERSLKSRDEAEARHRQLEVERIQMKKDQDALRETNVELASKVVGVEATLATLYRYTKQLNVGDAEQLYTGVTQLLAEVLRTDVVSVWKVTEPGQLVLAARQGPQEESPIAPVIGAQIESFFDKHGVLAVHDLPSYLRSDRSPFLLSRLTAGPGGRVIAYLAIEKMPFARYGSETIRLFTLISDWASDSLGRALRTPVERKSPPPLRTSVGKSRMFPERKRPDSMLKLVESFDETLGTNPGPGPSSTTAPGAQPTAEETNEAARSTFANTPFGNLLLGINDYVSGEKKRNNS